MRRSFIGRVVAAFIASLLGLAAVAPGAGAEIVLGSTLSTMSSLLTTSCPAACTLSQKALPGTTLVAPVDGVVLRWELAGGSTAFGYRLQVLRPRGLGVREFEETAVTASDTPLQSGGKEVFPAFLPVHAGETIGIELEPGAPIDVQQLMTSVALRFEPPVTGGSSSIGSFLPEPDELGFNAQILPTPRITAVNPASGPLQGGNRVTIEGTDLFGVTQVRFGRVPAIEFEPRSENAVIATVPPDSQPEQLPVTLTTISGTATSPSPYRYLGPPAVKPPEPTPRPPTPPQPACLVPRLKGSRLGAAKRTLAAANCRTGALRRLKGATARAARVIRQDPGPGSALPAGSTVDLTLASPHRPRGGFGTGQAVP